jgi:hypothetical protein
MKRVFMQLLAVVFITALCLPGTTDFDVWRMDFIFRLF